MSSVSSTVILLGTSSADAVNLLKQLYRPLVMRGVPVIVTNHNTAELVRETLEKTRR
jgi:UDP-glucose 6-dehydrogenase